MVYIGCVLIIILAGIVGKFFSNKYVYRDKFYQFLINMCVYFKSSIGFNHSKIEQLFDDINEGLGKEFSKEIELLKNICTGVNVGESEVNTVFYNLNKEEREIIISRIKQIGLNEDKCEVEKLDQFLEFCKLKKREYENQRKSMQPLCYKVSLAIGAVLCILIA